MAQVWGKTLRDLINGYAGSTGREQLNAALAEVVKAYQNETPPKSNLGDESEPCPATQW